MARSIQVHSVFASKEGRMATTALSREGGSGSRRRHRGITTPLGSGWGWPARENGCTEQGETADRWQALGPGAHFATGAPRQRRAASLDVDPPWHHRFAPRRGRRGFRVQEGAGHDKPLDLPLGVYDCAASVLQLQKFFMRPTGIAARGYLTTCSSMVKSNDSKARPAVGA